MLVYYTTFTLRIPVILITFLSCKICTWDFHQCIRNAKVGIVLKIQSDCNRVTCRTKNPNTLQWHSLVINTFIAHTRGASIPHFYSYKGVFSAWTYYRCKRRHNTHIKFNLQATCLELWSEKHVTCGKSHNIIVNRC